MIDLFYPPAPPPVRAIPRVIHSHEPEVIKRARHAAYCNVDRLKNPDKWKERKRKSKAYKRKPPTPERRAQQAKYKRKWILLNPGVNAARCKAWRAKQKKANHA